MKAPRATYAKPGTIIHPTAKVIYYSFRFRHKFLFYDFISTTSFSVHAIVHRSVMLAVSVLLQFFSPSTRLIATIKSHPISSDKDDTHGTFVG
jgi:hypothetical protein